MPESLILGSRLDTTGALRDAQRFARAIPPVNLKINEASFSRPLGKITGQASEFNKSLEASNARVIAFGASAGLIFVVRNAFAALLRSTIEVEKALTDINVIFQRSNESLNKFSGELFNVAKNTGQSFKTVATAATELARQGLGVEETLKRTRDALILTRLSGLEAADSVEALTATLNSFSRQALDSTEIVNKFAAVDAQFAVSSRDLAEATKRVASTAQEAGVSFEELLGIVTAVQQTTARGGSVIGNALKTIFTRIGRADAIQQLQALGVAIDENQTGVQKLQAISQALKTADTTTANFIKQLAGGVYQINIVSAALADLGRENGITARAIETANSAGEQAVRRNEELNKTIAAQVNRTVENFRKLGSTIGTDTFAPTVTSILSFLNKSIEGTVKGNEGKFRDTGEVIGSAIFKGLGQFISGPGLVLVLSTLTKLSFDLSKFAVKAFGGLVGLNQSSKKQVDLQAQITNLLHSDSSLRASINQKAGTQLQLEQQILATVRARLAEEQKIDSIAKQISRSRGATRPINTTDETPGLVKSQIATAASQALREQGSRRGRGATPESFAQRLGLNDPNSIKLGQFVPLSAQYVGAINKKLEETFKSVSIGSGNAGLFAKEFQQMLQTMGLTKSQINKLKEIFSQNIIAAQQNFNNTQQFLKARQPEILPTLISGPGIDKNVQILINQQLTKLFKSVSLGQISAEEAANSFRQIALKLTNSAGSVAKFEAALAGTLKAAENVQLGFAGRGARLIQPGELTGIQQNDQQRLNNLLSKIYSSTLAGSNNAEKMSQHFGVVAQRLAKTAEQIAFLNTIQSQTVEAATQRRNNERVAALESRAGTIFGFRARKELKETDPLAFGRSQERLSSRLFNTAFIASIAAPIVSNLISESAIGTRDTRAKRATGAGLDAFGNTLSFAGTGAILGSSGGPLGIGVGAGIGAAFGAARGAIDVFRELGNYLPEFQRAAKLANEELQKTIESIAKFTEIQRQLTSIDTGEIKVSVEQFSRLQSEQASALTTFTEEQRKRINEALNIPELSTRQEKLDQIFDQISLEKQDQSLRKDFLERVIGFRDASSSSPEFRRNASGAANQLLDLITPGGKSIRSSLLGDENLRNVFLNAFSSSLGESKTSKATLNKLNINATRVGGAPAFNTEAAIPKLNFEKILAALQQGNISETDSKEIVDALKKIEEKGVDNLIVFFDEILKILNDIPGQEALRKKLEENRQELVIASKRIEEQARAFTKTIEEINFAESIAALTRITDIRGREQLFQTRGQGILDLNRDIISPESTLGLEAILRRSSIDTNVAERRENILLEFGREIRNTIQKLPEDLKTKTTDETTRTLLTNLSNEITDLSNRNRPDLILEVLQDFRQDIAGRQQNLGITSETTRKIWEPIVNQIESLSGTVDANLRQLIQEAQYEVKAADIQAALQRQLIEQQKQISFGGGIETVRNPLQQLDTLFEGIRSARIGQQIGSNTLRTSGLLDVADFAKSFGIDVANIPDFATEIKNGIKESLRSRAGILGIQDEGQLDKIAETQFNARFQPNKPIEDLKEQMRKLGEESPLVKALNSDQTPLTKGVNALSEALKIIFSGGFVDIGEKQKNFPIKGVLGLDPQLQTINEALSQEPSRGTNTVFQYPFNYKALPSESLPKEIKPAETFLVTPPPAETPIDKGVADELKKIVEIVKQIPEQPKQPDPLIFDGRTDLFTKELSKTWEQISKDVFAAFDPSYDIYRTDRLTRENFKSELQTPDLSKYSLFLQSNSQTLQNSTRQINENTNAIKNEFIQRILAAKSEEELAKTVIGLAQKIRADFGKFSEIRAKEDFLGGRIFQDQFLSESVQSRNQRILSGDPTYNPGVGAFNSFVDSLRYESQDLKRDLNERAAEFGVSIKDAIKQGLLQGIQEGDFSQVGRNIALAIANKIAEQSIDSGIDAIFGALTKLGTSYFGGKKDGGIVGFSQGGMVRGGSGIRDDVPALLTAGEYVIKQDAVNQIGAQNLEKLNQGQSIDGYAMGGKVKGYVRGGRIQFPEETNQYIIQQNVRQRRQKIRPEDRAGKGRSKIDPDSLSQSVIEEFADGVRFNLVNAVAYNNNRRPTQAIFRVDKRLTSFATEDEDNPQNQRRVQKEITFLQYRREKKAYERAKKEALDAFDKQNEAILTQAYISAATQIAAAGIGSIGSGGSGGGGVEGGIDAPTSTGFPSNTAYVAKGGLIKGYQNGGIITSNRLPNSIQQRAVKAAIQDSNNLYRKLDSNFNSTIEKTLSKSARGDAGDYFNRNVAENLTDIERARGELIKRRIDELKQEDSPRTFFNLGGRVRKYNFGGRIKRYEMGSEVTPTVFGGTDSRDTVPAMLMGGEFVVRKDVVDRVGVKYLDDLNKGKVRGYAYGGLVASPTVNPVYQPNQSNDESILRLITVAESIRDELTRSVEKNRGNIPQQERESRGLTINLSNNITINREGNVSSGTTNRQEGQNRDDNSTDQERAKKLNELIKNQCLQVIIEQQRPNGLLSN